MDQKEFERKKQLADNGNAQAAYEVGMEYKTQGLNAMLAENREEEDFCFEQYFDYIDLAIENGSGEACYEHGLLSLGFDDDAEKVEEAETYFRKGALLGNSDCQLALSEIVEVGWLHWLCCAYLAGNEEASKRIKDFISSESDGLKAVEMVIDSIKERGIEYNIFEIMDNTRKEIEQRVADANVKPSTPQTSNKEGGLKKAWNKVTSILKK